MNLGIVFSIKVHQDFLENCIWPERKQLALFVTFFYLWFFNYPFLHFLSNDAIIWATLTTSILVLNPQLSFIPKYWTELEYVLPELTDRHWNFSILVTATIVTWDEMTWKKPIFQLVYLTGFDCPAVYVVDKMQFTFRFFLWTVVKFL